MRLPDISLVKVGAAIVLAIWIVFVIAFVNGVTIKVESPPAKAAAQ